MKSISSKKLNEWMNTENPIAEENANPMGLDPLLSDNARLREALEDAASYFPNEHNNHLWSQKFFSVDTESWKWISDQESGFPYVATHLSNAIDYILWNRKKHQLPKSTELEEIIAGFVKTPEEVFKNKHKGGFDVVIGNPPYVLCQPSNTNEETLNFYKSFEVASYKIDLFHLFFERGTNILRDGGKLGFITPNTYLSNKYIQKLRNFILKNTFIEEVINYNEIVFVDAGVDVATLILTKDKSKNENIKIYNSERGELKFITTKSQNSWNEAEEQVFNLKNDFFFEFKDCIKLEEIGNTYFGIQAYDRKSSISDRKINENYISIIDGADIVRFQYSIPNKYFNYLSENIKSGGDLNVYSQDRIVISQIGQSPKVGFCEKGILTSNTIYNLFLKDSRFSLKYILAILNSQLIKSYWLSKYNDNKDLFPKIKGYQLKQLPIKEISLENQQPFIEKANLMLSLNKELQEISEKFQRNLQREFSLETLSKKLQNWYELSFADFLKELSKSKGSRPLGLSEKAEWEDYFLQEQQKAISIKSKIEQTDAAIDQMVYELYGLTEEEIEIVENS